jgi:hypothetical protein
MSQTLVPNGIPVNFGFKSTSSDYGITQTVLTGYLLQSADYETGADVEDVRALQGDKVSRNWYDLFTKASLRLIIAATASRSAAITATTLSPFQPGTIISITACASHGDLVGTNWECQPGAKIAGDITKSAEITIPLEKRPGITAAQS